MKMDKSKLKSKLPIFCESCKACNQSDAEYRKLISLSNSALNVYINTAGQMETSKKDSIILHNVGNKVLKKSEIFGELCRRKTKCFLCNTLIQKVCNLINEVTEIKGNEMIAVCEHCKRSTAANKCQKCDEMIKKFLNNQINQHEYRQQALKLRLYEVQRILSLIVDKKNICDHKICQAYYDSNAELKILLELIKSPLPGQRSDTEEYFSLMKTRRDSVRENVGNDFFLKCSGLLYESKESLDFSASESRSGSFCICKYLRNRNIDSTPSLTLSPSILDSIPVVIKQPNKELTQEKPTIKALKILTESSSAEKTTIFNKKVKEKEEKKVIQKKSGKQKKIDVKDDKENISVNKQQTDKKSPEENKSSKHPKQDEEIKLMMKLLKDREKEKKLAEEASKKSKIPTIPIIADLPKIKSVEKNIEIKSESSGSIVECSSKPSSPPEIVYGNCIIPFHEFQNPYSQRPLIYKVEHEFITDDNTSIKPVITTSQDATTSKSQSHHEVETEFPGMINYVLSNKAFIAKGWTQLPSTKIVRKMNVYKMIPAYPQFDWFANHKKQSLFYNTGEKLAEVDNNGCGRWFYKNGRVALEYYKLKDTNAGLKYVVYDTYDIIEMKKNKPRKILGTFDHIGNGILYDRNGNARLKYNQSEGLVIDKKIGPPGRWKWHTLNDPPALQRIYIDNVEESDKCFKDVVKQQIHDPDLTKRVFGEEMLAIEFENFVKEKARKMLQSYRPFEIRMKAVKINEYFSVRIMNQANIQLLFRWNQVSLKVNMGLLLVNNEIVDTTVSDVADVATPFDRPILRSRSVSTI